MKKAVIFNDTLKLTYKQGFPKKLDIKIHLKKPYSVSDFKEKEFEFDKPKPRFYPLPPTRTFLVQEINGKWIRWGHCLVTEQTIYKNGNKTRGKFKIIKIFNPVFMQIATKQDTPKGKSYF